MEKINRLVLEDEEVDEYYALQKKIDDIVEQRIKQRDSERATLKLITNFFSFWIIGAIFGAILGTIGICV